MKNKLKIVVGCDVAFNKLEDCTWFEVLKIDGYVLTVREASNDHDFAPQTIDKSLVKKVRPHQKKEEV